MLAIRLGRRGVNRDVELDRGITPPARLYLMIARCCDDNRNEGAVQLDKGICSRYRDRYDGI